MAVTFQRRPAQPPGHPLSSPPSLFPGNFDLYQPPPASSRAMSYYPDSSYPDPSYPHRAHAHHHHHHSGYAPPLDADPQLWQYFAAVDTNRSGALGITELQNALVNGNWSKFDLDTIKMLMNMFDTDRRGSIEFNEFARLWQYIADWQRVFRHFDRDQSGTIERRELADAMRNFGYSLSPALLNLLEHKYSSTAGSAYGPPGITFDRFVRACVTVKTLTEAFQRFDANNDGWARFSYEEFMRVTLGAP